MRMRDQVPVGRAEAHLDLRRPRHEMRGHVEDCADPLECAQRVELRCVPPWSDAIDRIARCLGIRVVGAQLGANAPPLHDPARDERVARKSTKTENRARGLGRRRQADPWRCHDLVEPIAHDDAAGCEGHVGVKRGQERIGAEPRAGRILGCAQIVVGDVWEDAEPG